LESFAGIADGVVFEVDVEDDAGWLGGCAEEWSACCDACG
jgi:hypothetical protein